MKNLLKHDEDIDSSYERVDKLLNYPMQIIQNEKTFCFSLDSVLLAYFASVHKHDKLCELCCGNAAVLLLLQTRENAPKLSYGVELQNAVASMAERSIALNGLEEKVKIINDDIRNIKTLFTQGFFDGVLCNPPYGQLGGIINPEQEKAIARHELYMKLEDVFDAAAWLLKFKGRLSIVHRPERMTEIFSLSEKYGLIPKRMQIVYPRIEKQPNMFLLECVKGASNGIKIERPLIIHTDNGYHHEIKRIFGE